MQGFVSIPIILGSMLMVYYIGGYIQYALFYQTKRNVEQRRGNNIYPRCPALLFCLLFFFISLSCCFLPVRAEENRKVLTVGVPTDRCPVIYKDEKTDEIIGIGADMFRAAAEAAGFDVSFREIREGSLKEALDNPDYDILMPFGSAIPSASGAESIVSDSLFETPFTLLTIGNRSLPPLNKLKVGMLRSLAGVADTVTTLYPGIEIVFYDTMNGAVKALRKNKVDALLHNSYVWSYYLQKPSYYDLETQPAAMFSMDFRAGTLDTPEGRELIERLNEGIGSLTNTYEQAVVLDYTSRRLYRYTFYDRLYQNKHVIMVGAILLLSVILIAIFLHRAQKLEKEKELSWLADHDPLTGVLNYDGFRKKAGEILREHPDSPYVMSYANIINFKYINDKFGRKAGDELLRYWLKISEKSLSEQEAVCRIESDHVAVLHCVDRDENLRRDDEEVIDQVRNFFVELGKENRIQISGGVYVLTPEDYKTIDIDHMVDLARLAEKKVRDGKKDGYDFYNPEQWEKGKRTADIISHLPMALKSGEIEVWYQPQIDYRENRIIGMEALCRWHHKKWGWIPPSEFIPGLENSGLIYDLDTFVWDRVCQDLKRWNEKGISVSASVNLSRSDIREDRDIPGCFRNLIRKYGISESQLRIEITETAFAKDPELLISTTEKLRKLGFQVEMDDFGSGYSSLHMLKEVSVDRIKLDMHFLTESGDPVKGQTIVGYMVQMIRSLGMDMIVEGVETREQAQYLLESGCAEMQGFYFHKPMPSGEMEKLLADAS